MRSREEAVSFARQQLVAEIETGRSKPNTHHYGLQELRDLMDFIYGGPPEAPAQELNRKEPT